MPRVSTRAPDQTSDYAVDDDSDVATIPVVGIPISVSADAADVDQRTTAAAKSRRELLDLAGAIIQRRLPDVGLGTWSGHCRQYFSADELLVFDALDWDGLRVSREVELARKIAKHQERAGTRDDRNAAAERLITARADLATRGPALQEQINQLTSELRSLQQSSDSAAAVCQAQTSALSALRSIAREETSETRRTYDEALTATGDVDARLTQLRAKREMILSRSRVEIGSLEGMALAVRLSAEIPNLIDSNKNVSRAVWHEFVTRLREELPRLESEMSALQAQRNRIVANAEKLLDCFAR